MISKSIKISNLEDINEFVAEANKVSGDITLKRGKFVIDAKSLLGVLAINIAEGVDVTFPIMAKEFAEFIRKYED